MGTWPIFLRESSYPPQREILHLDLEANLVSFFFFYTLTQRKASFLGPNSKIYWIDKNVVEFKASH